jgi:hypothetical protein
MSDFWIYFNIGLKHVLNLNAYDHVLFLLALTAAYDFKDWKRLLLLVSFFTLGHTISLFLSVFNVVSIKQDIVEFLIPITILITALYNLITAGKSSKTNTITFIATVTVFFGIIHGLGFSNYFNSILSGKPTDKLVPLFEFAIGIEAAQIIVVVVSILASILLLNFTKFNKRDWIIMISSVIIGLSIPMVLQNNIFQKINLF